MYLTKIKLTNFQIWKNLVLELCSGINVIIGPTNTGKTAVLRALAWFFHNRPTYVNTVYKRLGSETPMSVTVWDDRGNKVIRYPNAYKINDDKPLKAFGKTVPTPVLELFPMRPINWQRQLDPPFLVLDTGGQAAKKIGETTGAQDQDMIMAEWKIEKADTRNEIKRIEGNIKEAKETIKKLEDVPDLLEAASEMLGTQQEIAREDERLTTLKGIVHSIKEIDSAMIDVDLDDLLNKCDATRQANDAVNKILITQMSVDTIVGEITDIDNRPQIDFDGMEGSLDYLQRELAARANLSGKLSAIEMILDSYQENDASMIPFETVQGVLTRLIGIEQTFKERQENSSILGSVRVSVDVIARDIRMEESLQNDLDALMTETNGVCPLCLNPWESDQC